MISMTMVIISSMHDMIITKPKVKVKTQVSAPLSVGTAAILDLGSANIRFFLHWNVPL